MQLGLIRSLIRAGVMLFAAWAIFVFWQFDRAVRVSDQPFAELWDQRIEVASFIVLPPNILMLLPPMVCAVVATRLAGDRQEIGAAILLRICRWSANSMIALGGISILNILVNDPGSPSPLGDIGLRLAGVLVAAAISSLCLAVERTSPTG